MQKDKFNFYQTPSNKKYLYGFVGVLVLGSFVLSQLALPANVAGYSLYPGYENESYSSGVSGTQTSVASYEEDDGYYEEDQNSDENNNGYEEDEYYEEEPIEDPYPSEEEKLPRFNIYTPYVHTKTPGNDYYLLDVKNDSKGTGWAFPVSADLGNTLTFSMYYHNGVVDTVAYNTVLKIDMPTETASTHVITGYLWADNAENATPENPMTQSVTVNVSSPVKLEFVPGSVRWYPDQVDYRFHPPTPLPFGQTGDELLAEGLQIGNVIGCWEYSGYILFKVRVPNKPIAPDFQITKKARNLTQGQYTWSKTVYAKPVQRIGFLITIKNTGGVARSVYVRDYLPDKMRYVNGSLMVNGQPRSGAIHFGAGVPLGTLQPNQTVKITFEADTKEVRLFPRGFETTLINRAKVSATNAPSKEDTATIIVRGICDPNNDRPGSR